MSAVTNARDAASAVSGADRFGVRALTRADIIDALKLGFDDFRAKPSHMFVFGLVYLGGAILAAGVALDRALLPMVFPVVSGLALTGPFAAIVLYEISRRRDQGGEFSWGDAPSIVQHASTGAIVILALFLFAIFFVWLATANWILNATMGEAAYAGAGDFVRLVLTTPEGWRLIVFGNLAGFIFAAIVLATNVVSFPMLLERRVGAPAAVATSLRVTAKSPIAIAFWGLIIAGSMAVSAILFLIPLAVVIPVLGHASWRVYRKAVEPPA